MRKVAIIDYECGNVFSIAQAIKAVDALPIITNIKKEIVECYLIVLPGVGAFQNAMLSLKHAELDLLLLSLINKGIPVLGICLGMQLLFDKSQEFGEYKGLGVLKGKVVRFSDLDEKYAIPHTQWNKVILKKDSILFRDVIDPFFYFSHSYYAKPLESSVIQYKSVYGKKEFCCSVQSDNIFGVQFHPEKSSYSGLKVLKNFIEYSG